MYRSGRRMYMGEGREEKRREGKGREGREEKRRGGGMRILHPICTNGQPCSVAMHARRIDAIIGYGMVWPPSPHVL